MSRIQREVNPKLTSLLSYIHIFFILWGAFIVLNALAIAAHIISEDSIGDAFGLLVVFDVVSVVVVGYYFLFTQTAQFNYQPGDEYPMSFLTCSPRPRFEYVEIETEEEAREKINKAAKLKIAREESRIRHEALITLPMGLQLRVLAGDSTLEEAQELFKAS